MKKDDYLFINNLANEIDRKITRSRQDIKEGKFTLVNKDTTDKFISKLSKSIMPKK